MKQLPAPVVLLVLVSPALPGPAPKEDAKMAAARVGVKVLTEACEVYRLNTGDWPKALQDLTEGRPPALKKAEALKDPWGKPYKYDAAGPHNGGLRPDIWTVTPEKRKIGNWPEKPPAAPTVRDDRLRHELLRMMEVDQAVRKKININKPDAELLKKMEAIDRKNTARMKEIVNKHGWPGKSLVGEDGANAAWLLVQHADLDREFQKRCLGLLKKAVRQGEAYAADLAGLTDRVLVGEKKKQLYGTQFRVKNGELVPYPIEDEEHVEQRRKEMGLGTLAGYKKVLQKVYQTPAPKN